MFANCIKLSLRSSSADSIWAEIGFNGFWPPNSRRQVWTREWLNMPGSRCWIFRIREFAIFAVSKHIGLPFERMKLLGWERDSMMLMEALIYSNSLLTTDSKEKDRVKGSWWDLVRWACISFTTWKWIFGARVGRFLKSCQVKYATYLKDFLQIADKLLLFLA